MFKGEFWCYHPKIFYHSLPGEERYHLSQLLFPFLLSFYDFGTRFWSVFRSNPKCERFRSFFFESSIGWNGTLFPTPKFGTECMFASSFLVLVPRLFHVDTREWKRGKKEWMNERKKDRTDRGRELRLTWERGEIDWWIRARLAHVRLLLSQREREREKRESK